MELKQLIKNTEDRLIDYKNQLSNSSIYPDWFKSFLREQKNLNETILKKLVKEQTYLNQGLNPPFCYPND